MSVLQTYLFDNPILVKHARSRLRRQQLLPSIAITEAVALLVLWGCIEGNVVENGVAFGVITVLQAVILFLVGSSQVATTVAHARETGILDFHRVSPVSPSVLATGFLLGAPIREWVLFLCTLPFSLVCVGIGKPGLGGFLLVLIVMGTSALLYHALALLAGVTAKSRNNASSIVGIFLVLIWIGFASIESVSAIGAFTPIPTYNSVLPLDSSADPVSRFFSLSMSPLLLTLLHQVPLFAFLFVAAVRKLRQDRAFVYSKPVAILFHAVIGLFILGDILGSGIQDEPGSAEIWPMVVVYLMVIAGILLTSSVTPGLGAFENGVRRARKLGLPHLPLRADHAANWLPALAFGALVLLTTGIEIALAGRAGMDGMKTPVFLGAVVGACAVLTYASARQTFGLRYGKNGSLYFLLFLFFAWIVPLMVGIVAGIADMGAKTIMTIIGVSPVAGIALFGGYAPDSNLTQGCRVALVTGAVWTVLFLFLRVRAEKDAQEAAMQKPSR